MTEKMLLYELLGSSFLSSLFLEGNLSCVLLEGHWFQSFLWRKGKYKRETIKKHQDVVTEGCWLWPYVQYKFNLFMAKSGWLYGMLSHVFKARFHQLSFNQTKSGLQRTWRFFSQVKTSFHLIFGERFLQELLVSVIFYLQHS